MGCDEQTAVLSAFSATHRSHLMAKEVTQLSH